jgi:hypothetical protein
MRITPTLDYSFTFFVRGSCQAMIEVPVDVLGDSKMRVGNAVVSELSKQEFVKRFGPITK